MRNRPLAIAVAAVAAVSIIASCSSSKSSSSGSSAPAAPSSSAPSLTGSITVFAAASLTGTFTTLGKQFEAANSGTKVTFNFGSSGTLSTQITQGAPADVFASAAPANMMTVVKAGDATTSTNFVSNSMEIAVPPSNPANVTSLQSLSMPGVKVILCALTAPCGALAEQIFTAANVTVTPVSRQPDVKSTLAQITNGSGDAGMVYVTDVKAAGAAVKGVVIPPNENASTEYPIATLTHAANPTLAAAFVSYVQSPAGLEVLTAAGFNKP